MNREDFVANVNIVDVIGYRVNIAAQREGKFLGICPFHHEVTPSFTVDKEAQSYHCFGCGKQGDALDFIMQFELMINGPEKSW